MEEKLGILQNEQGIFLGETRLGNRTTLQALKDACQLGNAILPLNVLYIPPTRFGRNDDELDTILLYVKTPAGRTLALLVDRKDSIKSLKDEILKREQIHSNYQFLAFGGKWLEDDRRLADYNIQSNAQVHLVLYYSLDR